VGRIADASALALFVRVDASDLSPPISVTRKAMMFCAEIGQIFRLPGSARHAPRISISCARRDTQCRGYRKSQRRNGRYQEASRGRAILM
jgi:hypothetical protein